MLKTPGNLFLFLLIVHAGLAPAGPVYNPPWFNDPGSDLPTTLTGTLIHAALFSAANQQDVGYLLYLPPSYAASPQRVYPLILALHAGNNTETTLAALYLNTYNAAMAAGDFPEALIATPNSLPLGFYDDTTTGAMETFILGEWLPFLRANYRADPDPQRNLLYGFSMGGYGAVKFGLLHRDRFRQAIALDGTLFQPGDTELNQLAIWPDQATQDANSVFQFLQQNPGAALSLELMLISGAVEPSNYDDNLQFHNSLDALGIAHEYEALPGVAHNIGAIWAARQATILEFQKQALLNFITSGSNRNWAIYP